MFLFAWFYLSQNFNSIKIAPYYPIRITQFRKEFTSFTHSSYIFNMQVMSLF